jgi:hypothetical protein
MGSGKSAVLAEASDILVLRAISHASIDLDALATAHIFPKPKDDDVICRNLECVWKNCADLGLTRVLLARAIESRKELECCRSALSGMTAVICRLTASLETMQERVRNREQGMLQQGFVQRVAELNQILDQAQLEDFSLVNENRSTTEVAQEMLMRAGWLQRP